ncbi:MAG: ATP-grasp domain-containing protein, partial [Planctomycetaceae bacterium]
MRVFVSEFLCGGGWPDAEFPPSLAREGRAMLDAVLMDFAAVPGCDVVTTWDDRLPPCGIAGVDAISVASPAEERRRFDELAAACDATLVIAPEFDGLLTERCRRVVSNGGRLLGPDPDAVALCADKLRLAEHLTRHGLATVPTTRLVDEAVLSQPPFLLPLVIKPRDGAGSLRLFGVRTIEEFEQALAAFAATTGLESAIVQPWISGRALSAGVLIGPRSVQVLPLVEQHLSRDGRFRYEGGRLPVCQELFSSIERLVRLACDTIPGLHGYVGFDLLVREDRPVIVEINPRLTTSYIG